MNIQDNELSVIVPKVKWYQMEDELLEAEKLIEDLLEKGDNIVVVKETRGIGSVMDHRYRWETIYYSDFNVKGGGEIIQNVIETQKRDYKELLKRVDYSRHMKEDVHTPKVDEKAFKDKIEKLEKDLKYYKNSNKNLTYTIYALFISLISSFLLWGN